MAKNLIPEELEALIKEYLTDGALTDKERQVILKKAVAMGLDRDEIDLYLDAQVQKIDQETEAAVRLQKGNPCPHCGANVSQMTDKCPSCGQYITPEATKELEEILDKLEDALVSMKSWKDFDKNKAIVERYERKARMYYSNHPKVKALLAEVEGEKLKAESQLKSMKRKGSIISIIKNKRVWSALAIVIGIIIIAFNIDSFDSDSEFGNLCYIVGLFFVMGGVGGLFGDKS